jgi:alpha-L-rhamnosidase
MYGDIESSWTIEEGVFRLETEVPPNTTATVLLPGADIKDVLEGGKTLDDISGILGFSTENGGVAVRIGSGRFVFYYKWNGTPDTR